MTWLIATLAAGLLQAWRTAVQARVSKTMSVNAAGLVRYLYGLPVGIVLLWLYIGWSGGAVPGLGRSFLPWSAMGGLAQILGTNLLLMAFGHRNYVVGTAYAKTEAVQGALLALILIGEMISLVSTAGIMVSVAGVLVISSGGSRLHLRDMAQPAALCGLGAGFCFALTSIFVKLATKQVATQDLVMAAMMSLAAVLACQVIMQGLYVLARERNQIAIVIKSWRISGQVGVLAALGSACWFTGFALAPVALVRAIGQVEVIFTLLFSRFYLREQMKKSEMTGLLLVGIGVILTLAGTYVTG